VHPRRYIAVLLLTVLGGLAAIGTFNALVDPLELVSSAGTRGLDPHRPLVNVYARISKPAVDCRLEPSLVIVGTSRSQHALDPQSPALIAHGYRGFNLAFPGAAIYELRRAFDNAVACGSLQGALIELDFMSFDTHAQNAPDFEEALFRRGHGEWLRPTLEVLRLLTSLDMTWESIDTLRMRPGPAEVEPDGRETDVVFERRVERAGGVRGAFQRSERAQYIRPILAEPPDFRFVDGRANIAELDTLLQTASRNNVRLWFYFAPVHARHLETLRALGLWSRYEDWKATLVRFIHARARELSFPAPPEVWDFSGYNSVTTESVPPYEDSSSRMRGYWESSHLRKYVGDLMLARMFGSSSQQTALPADFGIRLTPANVDSNTERIRAEAMRYRHSRPLEEQEVQQEVQQEAAHEVKQASVRLQAARGMR
jgi:hypothetical protein